MWAGRHVDTHHAMLHRELPRLALALREDERLPPPAVRRTSPAPAAAPTAHGTLPSSAPRGGLVGLVRRLLVRP